MIVDYLLTSLILLALLSVVFYGSKRVPNDTFFMSKSYGVLMKGVCAIIVVLFHVPLNYQNPLQHFLGGYAFVAVTLFFLFSSYGMLFNVEHTPSYLHYFWKKRLFSLLCPVLIVNLVFFVFQFLLFRKSNLRILLHVDEYVVVLLQYCLLFYIANYFGRTKILRYNWQVDVLLILGVLVSSLFILFGLQSNAPSGENDWYVERYGLIWGLLLYRYFLKLIQWFNILRNLKIILVFIVSILSLAAYHSFKLYGIGYRYVFEILSALFIILLVFLLTQKRFFGNRISVLLGGISYEIYLSHRYVMELVVNICPSLSSGFFILLVVLVTTLVSYFAHSICKRLLKHFK